MHRTRTRHTPCPVLITSAILCTVLACDRPSTRSEAQIREQPSGATHVTPSSDTIALTYVCGNRFRLTHTGASQRDTAFRWATPSGASGVAQLHHRLPGYAYTETVFATGVTDSVYIVGLPGSLRAGNGARPDRTPPRDTVWPMAGSAAMYASMWIPVCSCRAAWPTRSLRGRYWSDHIRALTGHTGEAPRFHRRAGQCPDVRGMLILHVDQPRADYSSHISFVDSLAASSLFDFAAPVLVSGLEGLDTRDSRSHPDRGTLSPSDTTADRPFLFAYGSTSIAVCSCRAELKVTPCTRAAIDSLNASSLFTFARPFWLDEGVGVSIDGRSSLATDADSEATCLCDICHRLRIRSP